MNTKKILIILMILIILITGIILIEATLEQSPRNYYTYTKAICDEKNFCQDYLITCENKTVKSFIPITGASVQFPENWKDTRENKSEILCE